MDIVWTYQLALSTLLACLEGTECRVISTDRGSPRITLLGRKGRRRTVLRLGPETGTGFLKMAAAAERSLCGVENMACICKKSPILEMAGTCKTSIHVKTVRHVVASAACPYQEITSGRWGLGSRDSRRGGRNLDACAGASHRSNAD